MTYIFRLRLSDLIVSGSLDLTVRVWSLCTGSQVTVFEGHQNSMFGVAICGNIPISGSGDKSVRIWNIMEN
jgi:WD40 repeat protein